MARPRRHTPRAAARAFIIAQLGVTAVVAAGGGVGVGIADPALGLALAGALGALGALLAGISAWSITRHLAGLAGALPVQIVAMVAKMIALAVVVGAGLAWGLPRVPLGLGALVLVVSQAVAGAVGAHRTRVLTVDPPAQNGT